MTQVCNPHQFDDVLGDPLSDKQKTEIRDALEMSRKTIDDYYERQKLEPRLSYVRAAVAAGFTETQAEFLWRHRHRPEWRA